MTTRFRITPPATVMTSADVDRALEALEQGAAISLENLSRQLDGYSGPSVAANLHQGILRLFQKSAQSLHSILAALNRHGVLLPDIRDYMWSTSAFVFVPTADVENYVKMLFEIQQTTPPASFLLSAWPGNHSIHFAHCLGCGDVAYNNFTMTPYVKASESATVSLTGWSAFIDTSVPAPRNLVTEYHRRIGARNSAAAGSVLALCGNCHIRCGDCLKSFRPPEFDLGNARAVWGTGRCVGCSKDMLWAVKPPSPRKADLRDLARRSRAFIDIS